MDNGFFQRFFTQLERSISWLVSLLKAVGLGLLVTVAVVNFDAIASGFGGLFEKLPGIVKVSAFGVTIETNPADIEKTVKFSDGATQWLRENWGRQQSRNAAKALKSLDKRELARLMDVEMLSYVCRDENATSEKLYEYVVDKSLEEKKLVELTPRPDIMTKRLAEIKAQAAAPLRKSADTTAPSECYDLKLSSKGYDVRTVIIRTIGAKYSGAQE